MPSFDDALGIHPQALALRAKRSELIAANLANADTPGYRARDIDFREVFADEASPAKLRQTNGRHLSTLGADSSGYAIKFRQPLHASIDNNSVDAQAERAAFLDNALRHQASFTFLNGRITGMLAALRGE